MSNLVTVRAKTVLEDKKNKLKVVHIFEVTLGKIHFGFFFDGRNNCLVCTP
jgi:hypothetical protein